MVVFFSPFAPKLLGIRCLIGTFRARKQKCGIPRMIQFSPFAPGLMEIRGFVGTPRTKKKKGKLKNMTKHSGWFSVVLVEI